MRKIVLIFCFFSFFLALNVVEVKAKTLDENINEQLNNLDFSELEEIMNELNGQANLKSFKNMVLSMTKGDYSFDIINFKNYVFKLVTNSIKNYMPTIIVLAGISIFASIVQCYKSSFASEGVSKLINFVCLLSFFLLFSTLILNIYTNTKNTIETLTKVSEIMSPIILVLMLISGGTVSASLYKPSTLLFSNLSLNIFVSILLPLISLVFIVGSVSSFSYEIKLNGILDFLFSCIKWIIGIVVTCYGLYITIQGISTSVFDGVSLKATKYAIGNSIPIVGGFLKDGFDLIVASSIIIKNSIGFASIICLFGYILAPFLECLVLMLCLKILGAISNMFSNVELTSLCSFLSKGLTYLNAVLLLTGFMFFINVFIGILSSSAFV